MYYLKRLREVRVLHEDLYEVEAHNLEEALNKVINEQIESSAGGYLMETSEYTGDWDEVQHLVEKPSSVNSPTIGRIIYQNGEKQTLSTDLL